MTVAVVMGELKGVSTNREGCCAGPERAAAVAAEVGDGGRGRRPYSSYSLLRNRTPGGRGGDHEHETVEGSARRCLVESQLLKQVFDKS